MAYEANPGTNKLANVLRRRMQRESATSLILDFGEIGADGSLTTNTFPVPIPRGDYSVLRQYADADEEAKPGERVLVAWVQSEAVVIDIVMGS